MSGPRQTGFALFPDTMLAYTCCDLLTHVLVQSFNHIPYENNSSFFRCSTWRDSKDNIITGAVIVDLTLMSGSESKYSIQQGFAVVHKCALKKEMLIGMIAPCRESITLLCEKTCI